MNGKATPDSLPIASIEALELINVRDLAMLMLKLIMVGSFCGR